MGSTPERKLYCEGQLGSTFPVGLVLKVAAPSSPMAPVTWIMSGLPKRASVPGGRYSTPKFRPLGTLVYSTLPRRISRWEFSPSFFSTRAKTVKAMPSAQDGLLRNGASNRSQAPAPRWLRRFGFEFTD